MELNVDIIIPTINKRDKILLLLDMLTKQTIKPKKIFILNTLSDAEIDKCENIVFDNINVKEIKIKKENFNHGSTRNIAAKESIAQYLIFMTDDALPVDNLLIEKLYLGINKKIELEKKYNTTPAASYAKQIAYNDASFTEKKVREFNYKKFSFENNSQTSDKNGIKNIFLSNVCAIYDRKIFEKLGYFAENVDFNEDTLYADKAIKNGYSIIYNAEAKVYHSHDYTFKEQYNRNVLIGKSHKNNPEVFNVYKSESEGKKLLFYVCKECLLHLKFIELIKFIIECFYRYTGYKDGKKNN